MTTNRAPPPTRRRGQMLLEFIIMTALAVLIGLVYLVATYGLMADTVEQQRIQALNDVGYTIQDEMLLAASVDDGYIRSFIIPPYAGRFSYDIATTSDASFTLTSGGVQLSFEIPPTTFVGCAGFAKSADGVRRSNVITKDKTLSVRCQ